MIITFLLFSLLLAFNFWFFFMWPKRAFGDKFATVLQIVAVYAFGLGVLTQIGVTPALNSLSPDLTSPDLFKFLGGNLDIGAIGFSALSVALTPEKTAFSATASLEILYVLLLTPIAMLGFAAYVIFVMPWAYLANVFVSIPVNAILTSGKDYCISITGPNIGESSYCIKAAVQANTEGFRSFLVALPAQAIAFALRLFTNISKAKVAQVGEARTRHPQHGLLRTVVIYAMWGGQGFAGLLILLTIIITLPSLITIKAEPGEIYGATVIILLTVLLELELYRRIRGWRRNYQS